MVSTLLLVSWRKAMLVLTRREGESITIGGQITVTILRSGNAVKIGIEAPREITVLRAEVEKNEAPAVF